MRINELEIKLNKNKPKQGNLILDIIKRLFK